MESFETYSSFSWKQPSGMKIADSFTNQMFSANSVKGFDDTVRSINLYISNRNNQGIVRSDEFPGARSQVCMTAGEVARHLQTGN